MSIFAAGLAILAAAAAAVGAVLLKITVKEIQRSYRPVPPPKPEPEDKRDVQAGRESGNLAGYFQSKAFSDKTLDLGAVIFY